MDEEIVIDLSAVNLASSDDLATLQSQIAQIATALGLTIATVDTSNSESFDEGVGGDIHNERWIAFPTGNIPSVNWDDANECMTPGMGSVQLMRCQGHGSQTTYKPHWRTLDVFNGCIDPIPQFLRTQCGNSILLSIDMSGSATDVELPMSDGLCEEYCLTGTATQTGDFTVTVENEDGDEIFSGTVSATAAQPITETCFTSTVGTVTINGLGFLDAATAGIIGYNEFPNVVEVFQDTECCRWWVRDCGSGGSGESLQLSECTIPLTRVGKGGDTLECRDKIVYCPQPDQMCESDPETAPSITEDDVDATVMEMFEITGNGDCECWTLTGDVTIEGGDGSVTITANGSASQTLTESGSFTIDVTTTPAMIEYEITPDDGQMINVTITNIVMTPFPDTPGWEFCANLGGGINDVCQAIVDDLGTPETTSVIVIDDMGNCGYLPIETCDPAFEV